MNNGEIVLSFIFLLYVALIQKILSLEENVSVEIDPGNSKGPAGASNIFSRFKTHVFLV